MSRLLVQTVALTLVYALTLASFDPWDLALGAVLSVAILLFLRRAGGGERPGPVSPRRLLAFVPFAGVLLRHIAVGAWRVSAFVLRPRSPVRPGVVAVPLGDRTRLGVAVPALAIGLSPGSTVLEIDWPRRAMLVHVLDARDPDAVRAQLRRFYERYQRPVFP